MTKVILLERLDNPEYTGRLTTVEYYNLLIEAGYSSRIAQDAANKRGFARLASGFKM